MPEIPAEAARAATAAIEQELMSRSFDPFFKGDEALARVAVEAAAPFLAEHIATLIVTTPMPAEAFWRGWAARIAREAFPKEIPDAT